MMVKGRRVPVVIQHDEDTNDFDSLFFSSPSQGRSSTSSPEKPVQRNAANARERARMRVLSKAFTRLKTSLPWVPPDTKLSKLDTLRLATTYIAHLRKVLKEDDTDPDLQSSGNHLKKTTHPLTFTWPFTINKPNGSSGSALSPNHLQSELPEYPHQAVETTSYPNYPPCEYMTLAYTEQPRRDVVGHYLH